VPWKSAGGSGVTAVVDSEVGGRRAIAIKRALQEDDPNTIREFSLFVSARSDTIFTQSWTSVSVKIRYIC
jgi:acylglycerol lipase